ncbi:hypothetical protein SEVIR_2G239500v4 [Setaria viridis]|uniref:Uncharacterized protein n=2 Tax=Setaria TaxID=4554 RepID=A0A368Q2A2_SETIT|nr:hypothetical protein SETIT_2G229300v2 [Setaria italica]RCV11963.1 hypothetical protein SETIT_2G229300v2 [Setaria italica]TKW33487.1 hypothetical protein SEVIR_2G239500v2 [Setaria viridis]
MAQWPTPQPWQYGLGPGPRRYAVLASPWFGSRESSHGSKVWWSCCGRRRRRGGGAFVGGGDVAGGTIAGRGGFVGSRSRCWRRIHCGRMKADGPIAVRGAVDALTR